jgi:hypothetical protein
MATNFGFMPVLKGKRYFISYKSEDTERVGEITRKLNEMGVPMWYDYGIEKGEQWEREINRNIRDSEGVIIFATKALFAVNDTWVRIEFDVAQMYGKKRYVVWLDEINPYEHSDDVHDDLKVWYLDVDDLQGIRMAGKSVEQIAWSIVTEFHLINGNQPQPQSPVFQPTVKKPEPQPTQPQYTQLKPAQPTQSQYSVPMYSQPVLQPVQSTPQTIKPVTVKDTPLIIFAVALVVVIVGGIWAASTLSDNTTSSGYLSSSDSSTSSDNSTTKTGDQIEASDLAGLDVTKKDNYYTFTFGNYPQGENGEEEPIEWRVLTVDGDKALVISEKLLDYVSYNEEWIDVTWETCTLRSWMNNDFLNAAFSSSEQAKIATVTNQNPDNPKYGTKGGKPTQDKIFALSIEEAKKYFSSVSDRKAYTTDYAHKRGSDSDDRSDWWWLRSPGYSGNDAAYVYYGGDVDRSGVNVNINNVAVRPAFWLNL